MGRSGGSKSTSQSGSAQKWAQPFAKAAAGDVQDVFNQNQGSLENITKGVTGLLPGLSEQYQSWSPVTGQAQDYYGDVLSGKFLDPSNNRSEEHTSELQSLMRHSYAVFCLKKKKKH